MKCGIVINSNIDIIEKKTIIDTIPSNARDWKDVKKELMGIYQQKWQCDSIKVIKLKSDNTSFKFKIEQL